MSKHFLLNPKINPLSKEEKIKNSTANAKILKDADELYRELSEKRIKEEKVELRHTEGRIIIKIDMDSKDVHTFADGTKIERPRRYNNLNRRETQPVNCWVVDSEYIKEGSEILIHPNAICDANKIFNYADSAIEQGNSVRYYSIEETSAYLFREGEEWKPLKNFAIGLRVFKPYKGAITGIEPTQIENVLYLTSGEYANQCVQTLKACDYEIIFTGIKGREERAIRCRHYENQSHDREEIIIIRHDLTKRVKNGKLLIGLTPNDAKKLTP